VGALDWDHNAHHWPRLLGLLPARCERVLDVGCGAGGLATQLARRVPHVDAVDRSPEMVARARSAVPANVRVVEADVLTWTPPHDYRAVVSVAALHHLPLEPALERLASFLRPGGVLAAVALPRVDLPRELPVEVVSAVGHRVIGLRQLVRGERWTPTDGMPVHDGELSVRDVRRRASSVLPGVEVCRLRYWRYLLTWRRPA
jgi:SAM-dependent methyltransferase